MSDAHPFVPGTEVMVQANYSHYGAGKFTPDTVLKLHKTGRFTLTSDPAKQWSARQSSWEVEKTWFGYPTSGHSGYSIYSTRLRLMDDAAKVEYETTKAKSDHNKRCAEVAERFSKPAGVSYDLSKTIAAMIADNPLPSTPQETE